MQGAKKLNKSADQNVRKVCFNPDLTPLQRAQQKEIRDQIKQRRATGANTTPWKASFVRPILKD